MLLSHLKFKFSEFASIGAIAKERGRKIRRLPSTCGSKIADQDFVSAFADIDTDGDAPWCIILGGPNGSGKSSAHEAVQFPGVFINTDEIAKPLEGKTQIERDLKAGRIAIQSINDLVANKQSFVFETTLSSNHSIRVIEQAKGAGFKIGLLFIALDSADRNIERVAFRVAAGGHHIPDDAIVRRYVTSFEKLREALPLADEAVLIDNTASVPFVVRAIRDGQAVFEADEAGNPLHVKMKSLWTSR